MFIIKRLIHKWLIKRMSRDIKVFIDTLQRMSAHDVSLIVVAATVTRNALLKCSDIDFRDPILMLKTKPSIMLDLSKTMNESKRKAHSLDQIAYSVWLHTLRVISQPDLANLGKDLWNELARGIDYLNNNPSLVERCTTECADPSGYQLIPL